MDYKYIEQLMDRYWECETSLEEEQILRTFFSQESVPVYLLPYKDLFTYEHDELHEEKLGEDFDRKMLEMVGEKAPVKAREIRITEQHNRPKTVYQLLRPTLSISTSRIPSTIQELWKNLSEIDFFNAFSIKSMFSKTKSRNCEVSILSNFS